MGLGRERRGLREVKRGLGEVEGRGFVRTYFKTLLTQTHVYRNRKLFQALLTAHKLCSIHFNSWQKLNHPLIVFPTCA